MIQSSWKLIDTVFKRTEMALADKIKPDNHNSPIGLAIKAINSSRAVVTQMAGRNYPITQDQMEILYQNLDHVLSGILELNQTIPYDNLIIMTQLCLENVRRHLEMMDKYH